MLKIVALYLCLTIFLVSGNGNVSTQVVSTAAQPKVAETTSENGTIVKEPTKAPLPSNDTTTTPETTTTVITTTTTPVPTSPTTTPAPITTSPPPKPPTTTPAPKPTTTAGPTTTTVSPPTTPAPAPQTGEWIVGTANTTCIIVKMAVQFNVSYLTTDNKTKWQELTLPTDKNSTIASGNCGAKEQTLNLTWHSGEDSLLIHFTKNETTKHYSMHHVEVSLGSHEFPNIASNATVQFTHGTDQFPTKVSNSYRCMRLQRINLTGDGMNQTTGFLEISQLQFQAFRSDNATTFGLAEDCSSEVPDVVPIAVGCSLAVLVIIVLVAYLFGRRRSQARGYLSM